MVSIFFFFRSFVFGMGPTLNEIEVVWHSLIVSSPSLITFKIKMGKRKCRFECLTFTFYKRKCLFMCIYIWINCSYVGASSSPCYIRIVLPSYCNVPVFLLLFWEKISYWKTRHNTLHFPSMIPRHPWLYVNVLFCFMLYISNMYRD